MAYRANEGEWRPRETGSVRDEPVASGAHPSQPSAALDTLSWIRALASQWEDDQSRAHAPGFGLESDRR